MQTVKTFGIAIALVGLSTSAIAQSSTEGPSGRQIRGSTCYQEKIANERVLVRPASCYGWRHTVRALWANYERGPVIINGSHGE